MRKFVFFVVLFFFGFQILLLTFRVIWVKGIPMLLEHNFVKPNTHMVVLGASNGEDAWNDSIVPHSLNLCCSRNSMGACYNTLKWVTDYNDNNIDTILLCASIIAFVYQQDGYDVCPEVEEYRSVLTYKDYFSYFKSNPDYWKMVFTTFPYDNFRILRKFHGAYNYLDRNKLGHPELFSLFNLYMSSVNGNSKGWTEQKIRELCTYQVLFFQKIRDYCKAHHQTLVILSTPLYKIPEMLDDQGYRLFLRSELGDSALIADYSRFEFPDSSYYADLEHLNFKGARFFSEHIAREGLKLQYAIDYSKQ